MWQSANWKWRVGSEIVELMTGFRITSFDMTLLCWMLDPLVGS
jgi:hypothetical protein